MALGFAKPKNEPEGKGGAFGFFRNRKTGPKGKGGVFGFFRNRKTGPRARGEPLGKISETIKMKKVLKSHHTYGDPKKLREFEKCPILPFLGQKRGEYLREHREP